MGAGGEGGLTQVVLRPGAILDHFVHPPGLALSGGVLRQPSSPSTPTAAGSHPPSTRSRWLCRPLGEVGRGKQGGSFGSPGPVCLGRSSPRGNPPWHFPLPFVRRSRGSCQGERQWGAGTAGVRFGTVWYHREPRPISGPPAAVSPPGVLECLSTLERHFNTTGGETFEVVHTRPHIFVLGGVQRPTPTAGGATGDMRRRTTTKVAAHLSRGRWGAETGIESQ